MSSNAFKDYLIMAGQFPLLTAEEELELGRRISEGDMSAREALINSNLRLVVSIAKKYKNSYLSIDELVEEGNIGLITAVDRYDYTLKYRFSTFASIWIKQAILKALSQNSRMIRIPAHVQQELTTMKSVIDTYLSEHNEEPSTAYIAAALGCNEERVVELQQWRLDTISMDTPLDDEDKNTVGDLVSGDNETPVDYVDKLMLQDSIRELVNKLPTRTQTIIKMRFGLGQENDPEDWQNEHTLEEIGDTLEITRERVRQILKEVLQELQMKYENVF